MAEGHDGGGSSREPHAPPETGSHHPALAEARAAPPHLRRGAFSAGNFQTATESFNPGKKSRVAENLVMR